MELRRAAQVLLDCRWFVKDYRQHRRKLTDSQTVAAASVTGSKNKLRVLCSLAPHLSLQMCCSTQQPIDEIVVPLDADLSQLKQAAEKHFRTTYPPLAKFRAGTIRFRESTKPQPEHISVRDCQRRRGLDEIFEIVGKGIDLSLLNKPDPNVKVMGS